ncbi:MAG: lamin tail domain-containing protein [Rubricoccaceae bacterium]|nr:lamin tail domain-containing protein [Rubricoccaceae bacterium]
MPLRYALLLTLLAAALPAAAQANLSGVVVNEILADPNSDEINFDTDGDGEAEADDEFVELYNASAGAVDISGWQVYDASTTGLRHTFAAGTVLDPDGYIVVVGEWDPGSPPPGIVVANGDGTGAPGLGINNSGDELFLYDPDADAYVGAYFNGEQSAFTGPGTATNEGEDDFGEDTDGESLQRRPSGSDTIVSAMPTPLEGVPVAAEEGPEGAPAALAAPQPNPTRAAASLALTVARTQHVRVTAHDAMGRRVAVLLDRTLVAGERAALALDASVLPAGVYVVRAQGEDFTQSQRVTVRH